MNDASPAPRLSGEIEPTAAEFLRGLDARWAGHISTIGACTHRAHPAREPFEALVRAVAYQQLHPKAGDAILGRLMALQDGAAFPTPEQLLSVSSDAQRACGFSASKVATIRGLAQATLDGVVPSLQAARALDDEALIARLIPLKGIGRWTVEMLLIYSLQRLDVLPADDFGVRNGYRLLQGLPSLPTPARMRAFAADWHPHRTAAAWYLWRISGV